MRHIRRAESAITAASASGSEATLPETDRRDPRGPKRVLPAARPRLNTRAAAQRAHGLAFLVFLADFLKQAASPLTTAGGCCSLKCRQAFLKGRSPSSVGQSCAPVPRPAGPGPVPALRPAARCLGTPIPAPWRASRRATSPATWDSTETAWPAPPASGRHRSGDHRNLQLTAVDASSQIHTPLPSMIFGP